MWGACRGWGAATKEKIAVEAAEQAALANSARLAERSALDGKIARSAPACREKDVSGQAIYWTPAAAAGVLPDRYTSLF